MSKRIEATFDVFVNKSKYGFIAETVDYEFIAQGSSVDDAIECLVNVIDIQCKYDLKKGREPWQNHRRERRVSISSDKRMWHSNEFLPDSKKEVALNLALC
ncbi:hypothetical protein [Leptospira biflexa]|uniref:hypothetical protein n=1 Tax=Leptospira biflexa TaxID=172 RepID=UPI0010832284|nr:hypothetical protein [Leptospira biflexa]TGM32196.1 hypothetical protein EHQ80_18045 [Leptospira biflexa]TGM42173.1 hypothetical protein EHQ89_01275 [Leptospira biflexa]